MMGGVGLRGLGISFPSQRAGLRRGKGVVMRNESTLDRWIRVIVGAVLIWLGGWAGGGLSGSGWGITGLAVGAILAFTGFTGFCALYRLLGISTYREKK